VVDVALPCSQRNGVSLAAKPPSYTDRSRARFGAYAVALAFAAGAGCTCSHGSEPEKSADYHPTSPDGLAASPPSSAQAAGMTAQEYRDVHIHVPHELCNQAFERINVINGKPPGDGNALAKMQYGACVTNGNKAWYKCLLAAETPADLSVCNKRFMIGP